MSAIDQLGTLKDDIPELFDDAPMEPDWDDDWVVVPVGDPTAIPAWDPDRIDRNRDEEDPEAWPEPHLPDPSPDDARIVAIFGGSHPGAPTMRNPAHTAPSPDCLAFYLPFHYYHPDWWGVYLRFEGVEYLAGKIRNGCTPSVPWPLARAVARTFLYYHEAFHHKTESFATRLEVSHRSPLYRKGFETLYRNQLRSPSGSIEEALANGTALDKVAERLARHPLKQELIRALCDWVRQQPAGYCDGINTRGSSFGKRRSEFSEENHQSCFPQKPRKSPEIWETATHMYDPIANVKSQVNYILPASSPLASRIPLKGRLIMTPRQVRKKIRKLKGLSRLAQRHGRHPMYETDDGRRFPIPEHARDLPKGTLDGIIEQAGLDMNLREFQRA